MIIIGGVYVGGCMFIKGGCTCIKALVILEYSDCGAVDEVLRKAPAGAS
jgi:hypothetical protein